jgi:hypothetical protein
MIEDIISSIEQEIRSYESRLATLKNTLEEIRNWDEISIEKYLLNLAKNHVRNESETKLSKRERIVADKVKELLEDGKPYTIKELFTSVENALGPNTIGYANFRYMVSQKFVRKGILGKYEAKGVENEFRYWYAHPFMFNGPGQPKMELFQQIKKALEALSNDNNRDIISSQSLRRMSHD